MSDRRAKQDWMQRLAEHLWARLFGQLMVRDRVIAAIDEFESVHPEIPFPTLRPLVGEHGIRFDYEGGLVEIKTAGGLDIRIDHTGCVVESKDGRSAYRDALV